MPKFIEYSLVNSTYGKPNVNFFNNRYVFNYPCQKSYECTNYELNIKKGTYLIEVYGASAGYSPNHVTRHRTSQGVCPPLPSHTIVQSNVGCPDLGSVAGSGGYTSGIITLPDTTKAYLAIGGKGQYSFKDMNLGLYEKDNMVEGGYNGGGWASTYFGSSSSYGASSGGGSTDLRFEEDDVFHRVIVAGAGGGTDDQVGRTDDGSGGSGGGLIAQGYWKQGTLDERYVATQTSGFTFGSGESAREDHSLNQHGSIGDDGTGSDRGGSGSGWFGGFASHIPSAGCGGGSSFVLTADAEIPQGTLTHHDPFYDVIDSAPYAFADKQKYIFTNAYMLPGVWAGNGMAIITLLDSVKCKVKTCKCPKRNLFIAIMIPIQSFM